VVDDGNDNLFDDKPKKTKTTKAKKIKNLAETVVVTPKKVSLDTEAHYKLNWVARLLKL
jgi:hypothetical protein